MTTEQAALLERWRSRADSYDTAASGYNRKCIAVKGVQLTLRAIEVRKCADELEALNAQGANPQATAGDAQDDAQLAAAEPQSMAEGRPESEAPSRQRPANT